MAGALFPSVVSSIRGPGSLWTNLTGTFVPDETTLLVLLSVSTALVTVVSFAVHRWCEHRATEQGLLHQTTGS